MFEGTYVERLIKYRTDVVNDTFPMMAVCVKDKDSEMYKTMILFEAADFNRIANNAKSENLVRRLIDLHYVVCVVDPEDKDHEQMLNEDRYENGVFRIADDYSWRWLKFSGFRPWLGVLCEDDSPVLLKSLDEVLNKTVKFVAEYLPDHQTWNIFYDETDAAAERKAKLRFKKLPNVNVAGIRPKKAR